VSKELVTIFRAEELAKQKTGKKHTWTWEGEQNKKTSQEQTYNTILLTS
jgi:hypothetical protein